MPTTPARNLLYRLALPVLAPSPRSHARHSVHGDAIVDLRGYTRLLNRHHVLGASLLLSGGGKTCAVYTSTDRPPHPCDGQTVFRVASLTKMATALAVLRLCERGLLALDAPVAGLLPGGESAHSLLDGVTVAHLLSHTSGLRDIPAVDSALRDGLTLGELAEKHAAALRASKPGETFAYCNFGFGLLGCVLEAVTQEKMDDVFAREVFGPLRMRATLAPLTLPREAIMPITRVLPHRGEDMVIPPLGLAERTEPDPERHFGLTAGSLYTDAASLSHILSMLADGGLWQGGRYLKAETAAEMTRAHAAYGPIDPRLSYGLGLLIVEDRGLSPRRLLGHQGFAYGCADGAFLEEGTGRQIIFLNGGCSEARRGRLGLCNRDVLAFGLKQLR